MTFKRLTAALASGLLLWGSAYAEQQPEATAPDANAAIGATGPGIVILELQGAQPGAAGAQQASPEEMLAMQLLLLQLLMMQAEPAAGSEVPTTAPMAGQTGT